MNSMYVASLELCKELHELSQWDDTPIMRVVYQEGEEAIVLNDMSVLADVLSGEVPKQLIPAYDLGYLLRKLAVYWETNIRSGVTEWCAETRTDRYNRFERVRADTPEDAACKLVIELFKQGTLTKET